jgi:hypothetical protein
VEYANNVIVQYAERGYKERAGGEFKNRLAMRKTGRRLIDCHCKIIEK